MNMDNQKDGTNTCICGKAGCMCGHHNGHSCLMKWLFRAALVLFVFWRGYMMGDLHGMVRGFGHEGMRGGYSMRTGGVMMPANGGMMGATSTIPAQ